MELSLHNLSVCFDKNLTLEPINYKFKEGVTCLLGENGSGKTTMLKAIYLLVKSQGEIYHNKQIVNKDYVMQHMSYLPQHQGINIGLSVLEVVLLGNYSKLGLRINKHLINRALFLLEILEIIELRDKKINKLSGGQRKLVYLAQSLLKQPKILLLDEPCNSLDINNQINVLECLAQFHDIIIIVAMHDINLTIKYANKIIFLKNGKAIFTGTAKKLTSSVINSAYDIDSDEFSVNGIKQYSFKKRAPSPRRL